MGWRRPCVWQCGKSGESEGPSRVERGSDEAVRDTPRTKRAPDGRSGVHRRGRTCLVAPFPGRGPGARRFAAGPLQEGEAFRTRGLSFYLPVPAILPVPARFLV